VRKIARHLHIGRRTIAKYLVRPSQPRPRRQRSSKLDPFKPTITELLQQDPAVTAVVIAQRLRPLGYDGGISILKEYLPANDSKSTGAILVPSSMTQHRANFMPSVLSSATAERCIWRSLIARPSRLSSAVISTLLKPWAVSQANSGMTTWPLLSLNMMAIWYGSIRAFSPCAREYGFFPRACHVAAAWEKDQASYCTSFDIFGASCG
jgi:hypothetical protein